MEIIDYINYKKQLVKSQTTPLKRKISQLSRQLGILQSDKEDIDDERYVPINVNEISNHKPRKLSRSRQYNLQKQPIIINQVPNERINSYKYININAHNDVIYKRQYGQQVPTSRNGHRPLLPNRKLTRQLKNPSQLSESRLKQQAEEELLPEFRGEWQRQYQKLKQLNEWKQGNGDKYWKDDERRVIMSFVDRGLKFGISRKSLIDLAGISNSSFKRWRHQINNGII